MTRSLRLITLAWLLGAALLARPAVAQDPSAQLPPGHPPIGGPAPAAPAEDQPSLPSGHPPINGQVLEAPPLPEGAGDNQALPPGHPPIDGQQAPARMPASSPVVDDSSLPPGTVVFRVRTGRDQPIGGLDLVVHIIRKTIAEGESRTEKTVKADADGTVRLDGLKIGSEWIYQATTKYASISYRSPEFQLAPAAGKRVALQVFDVTQDIDAARVGVKAFLALEPREEFLQIEQVIDFANLGDRTWTIPEIVVPLEQGYQAFQGSDETGEVRAEPVEDLGYRLVGFVRPGAQQISFRYQIPYSSGEALRFNAFMPPRVAQVRVISAATGSTRMRVDSMPEPVATRGNDGQRLFLTERNVLPGGDQIDQVTVNVQGLPVPGTARWYAVGLASAAVLIGLLLAFGRSETGSDKVAGDKDELQRARQALLEQLAELEQARSRGEVGPKTYERTRRQLVDSLARLIAQQQTAPDAARG